MYYNVVNCKQQLSSLTNVHYHANSSCPKARFPDFNPRAVQIPIVPNCPEMSGTVPDFLALSRPATEV